MKLQWHTANSKTEQTYREKELMNQKRGLMKLGQNKREADWQRSEGKRDSQRQRNKVNTLTEKDQ